MSLHQAQDQAENAMQKKIPPNKRKMQAKNPFDDESCLKLFLTISRMDGCLHQDYTCLQRQ